MQSNCHLVECISSGCPFIYFLVSKGTRPSSSSQFKPFSPYKEHRPFGRSSTSLYWFVGAAQEVTRRHDPFQHFGDTRKVSDVRRYGALLVYAILPIVPFYRRLVKSRIESCREWMSCRSPQVYVDRSYVYSREGLISTQLACKLIQLGPRFGRGQDTNYGGQRYLVNTPLIFS